MAVSVIIGCLISASASIAVLSRQLEAWGTEGLAALAVLLSSLMIAAQQYRGMVHRRRGAALAVASLFLVIGGLCALAAAACIPLLCIENWGQKRDSDALMAVLFFLVVGASVAAAALAVAWRNWRWAVRLKAAGRTGPKPRLTLGELFSVVTLLALTAAIARWSIGDGAPIVAVGKDVSTDLAPGRVPASATGICYRLDDGGLALEFTTDEATFRTWITEVVAPTTGGGAGAQALQEASHAVARGYRGNTVAVASGLVYSSIAEGSSETATFDRANGRVYYSRASKRNPTR
ncbi:MAG: hypothetical protein U0836_21765 [Pirellulales bacterium]